MIVRELMTGAVITAPQSMPILDARSLMLKERIRHLPVASPEGRLLGIVTDRDIRLNLPSRATSLSVWELNHLLAKLTVGEVMTTGVISVGPDRPAREAAQLMVEHQIGALPVEDEGRLVGIVTETDLLRAFIRMEKPLGAARR
jgi:acetoin utilization protein AcuB